MVDINSLPGAAEERERAERLAWRLPPELAPLARIALNYRWSWEPGGPGAVPLARPSCLGAERTESRAPA